MILVLVWAAGIAGLVASLVQLVRPSKIDLRPLIFGSIAVVILLGVAGLGWEGTLALSRAAQSQPDPLGLGAEVAATLPLLRATGYLAVAVAALGGIAVWIRAIALGRKRKKAAASPETPVAPAPGV